MIDKQPCLPIIVIIVVISITINLWAAPQKSRTSEAHPAKTFEVMEIHVEIETNMKVFSCLIVWAGWPNHHHRYRSFNYPWPVKKMRDLDLAQRNISECSWFFKILARQRWGAGGGGVVGKLVVMINYQSWLSFCVLSFISPQLFFYFNGFRDEDDHDPPIDHGYLWWSCWSYLFQTEMACGGKSSGDD